VGRDAVEGLGNAAGDGGKGVAVAAEGDGIADGILKGDGFEKGGHGLRHGGLAGFVEAVVGADLIEGEIDGVIVPLDVCADLFAAVAGARQIDGGGGRLGAFDALGVVVGNAGDGARHGEGILKALRRKAAGAHAHGGTVAEAEIGLGAGGVHPLPKASAVAAIRIALPDGAHAPRRLRKGAAAQCGYRGWPARWRRSSQNHR